MSSSFMPEVALEEAIVLNPLIVSPDISVAEAIACMTAARTTYSFVEDCGVEQRLQADARASCVLVMKDSQLIGVLTEWDVVGLSADKQLLNNRTLTEVMTQSVITLRQSQVTDIVAALHLLERHHVRHLLLTDEQEQVIGLLTQETLRYTQMKLLEQKISCLEAEKLELLQKHKAEVEQQVQQRTAELRKQAEREQLLSAIATHIHSSLELKNTLDTVVKKIQQFLQCDRVLVYQFEPDWSGVVKAEAVLPEWKTMLGDTITDSCLQHRAVHLYEKGEKLAVSNIYEAGYSDCHLQLLERYQVKANLVVPILVEHQLWGLLIGHQCRCNRVWEVTELNLLDRIAMKIAIAIQQSQAYEQIRLEMAERRQAEEALRQSEATNRAIIQGIPDLLIRMDGRGEYQNFLSGGAVKILLPPDDNPNPSVHDILPEPLATQRLYYTALALASGQLQVYEQQIEINCERYDEEVCITPLNQDEVLVIIRDITERKRVEASLRQSEAKHRALISALPDLTMRMSGDGVYLDFFPTDNFKVFGDRDLVGVGIYDRGLPPELAELRMHYIQQALQTGELQLYEQEILVDGELQTEEVRIVVCAENEVLIIVRDITGRKQAEDALRQLNQELESRIEQRTIELRQSEERFRQIFEQSPVGIAISDLEGHLIRVNSSLVQIVGYAKAKLLQQSIQDIISADQQRQGKQKFQQLMEQTLSVITFESQLISGQGETIWVNVTSALIFGAFGRPSSIVHLIEDVSERKQAEAKLLNLTSLQQAILNSTDYSIISTAPTGIIQTFNASAQRMLGYSGEEMLGKATPLQIHDPTELQQRAIALSEEMGSPIEPGFEVFIAKARQGISVEEEWTYVRKDGSRFPVLLSVSALRDRQGKITGFLETAKDITQQKQAEEELRRTLKALSDFKYALDEAAIVASTDAKGRITYANDRFCEISQYSRQELIGNSHRTINSGYHPKSFFTEMWVTISKGQPWRGEIQNRAKDGNQYWVDVTIIPFLNDYGQPVQHLAIGTDITARKWAELNAESLRNRLQFLLSSSPAVIYTCKASHDYNATSISENVVNLLGYEPSEFLQDSSFWINHIHPKDTPKVRSNFLALLQQGHYFHEYRFLHKDGSYRWMRDEMCLIRDSQGCPVEIIGYLADITDRKRMELELQELTVSLQNAMEGISRLDKQGRYLALNRAYAKPCGYEPEELVGVEWQTTVHPEDIPLMGAAYQIMLERGRVEAEARGIRKDGSLFYKQVTMVAALDQEGQFNGHYCFLKDISDRKAAEESLKRQLEAIEAAIDGIAILKGGTYTYLNKAHLQLLGYQHAEELLGKSWKTLYSFSELCRFEQEVFPVLRQQKSWQGEAIVTRKDGTTFVEGLSLTIIETGELICVCRDITAQKEAEKQLQQANEQLLTANAELAHATRLKDEFLANMSHELRTPLNAILGMTEGLQEAVFDPISERQKQAIETVERSGRHLLELINDILDLSKTESGKLELQIAPAAISYLCESSLTFVRQQATQKNIQLTSEIPQQLPNIAVDERRIRQVLINLLSNAVKFTPSGGSVKLEVYTEQQQDQTFLNFSVIDTGIGIAQADMDKLFQPFVQVDSRLNRQYAGTGLGLALVRRFTELHHGTVAVSSVLGKGSCFTVRIPHVCESEVHPTPAAESICLEALPLDHSSVLMIENSVVAAEQVTRYLKEMGMEVIIYPQGEGAIDEAIRHQPNLIVLDILLPNLSGWEVLQQLKAHPQTQHIPVVVVSVIDERSRGLSLGAAEYLIKPITREQLSRILRRLRSPKQSQEPHLDPTVAITPPGTTIQTKPFLILLAEDNEASVVSISSYLKARGYRLLLAKNGQEAVTLTKTQTPDLILMDVQMPGLDGLEAIQQIRADQRFAHIPIVALTALAMPSDREKCIAAGATNYFPKPVKLKNLVEMIQTLLERL